MSVRSRWLIVSVSGVILLLLMVCLYLFFFSVSSAVESPQCSEDLGLVFSEHSNSLEVLAVLDGSAADRKGIMPGDRILSADSVDLLSVEQLDSIIVNRVNSGAQSLLLRIQQNTRTRDTSVPLSGDGPFF